MGVDDTRDVLARLEFDVTAEDEARADTLSVAEADIVPFRGDALKREDSEVLEIVDVMVEFDGALGPGRDHEELEAAGAVLVMVPD